MDLDQKLAEAILLSEEKKFAEAHALLAELAAARPDSAEVFVAQGVACWKQNRREAASHAFGRAVALGPESETASRACFRFLWKLGERETARAEAARFLSRNEGGTYRRLVRRLQARESRALRNYSAVKRWFAAALLAPYPMVVSPLAFLFSPGRSYYYLPACLLLFAAIIYAWTTAKFVGRGVIALGFLVSAWHGWLLWKFASSPWYGHGGPNVGDHTEAMKLFLTAEILLTLVALKLIADTSAEADAPAVGAACPYAAKGDSRWTSKHP